MSNAKAIITLLRLPFMTVTIGAILLGSFFAYHETGSFNILHFVLALLGSCFFHIATNAANDYFDFKSGNDAANISATSPFSGGSRMVLEGLLKPGKALAISLIFAALGSFMGLYLNFATKGNVVLVIGILGLIFVYGYNGRPLQLVNIGLGEIAIFLAWGPLMVLGAYYVQAQSFQTVWPFIVAIPSGIMTTLVLLINEFADKDADTSTGRKTWVIVFGEQKALILYMILAYLCFVIVAAGVWLDRFPLWSLLVGITIIMPLQTYKIARNSLADWGKFLGAVKNTILMNLLFLVILSVSFLF
ncbi:MAG: prenyltransferase [Candidatus Aminicenantes bacterium]|nr:prenyltransferase [Candidatus Aminicenantes bacterium]